MGPVRTDNDTAGDAASTSAAAVAVRPAEPRDASEMAQLAHIAYAPYVPLMGREPAPMNADYVRIASCGDAWVAEQEGRLVGLLVLEPHADHLLLENMAVDPNRQSAGIGRRLLALAEEQARAKGLPEVRLFTNEAMTENLAYYGRRGYRETHRASQSGYQRVFFTKRLASRGLSRPLQ